jgi:8-oxo-dGTP diphosphatase
LSGQIHAVVCGVLVDGEKVLIQKRATPPIKWEFPGGKVQFGERLRNTLRRELQEEIECEVEILHLLHATTSTFEDHNVMVFYTCRALNEPSTGEWVTLEEMATYDIFPGLDVIGQRAIELEKSYSDYQSVEVLISPPS